MMATASHLVKRFGTQLVLRDVSLMLLPNKVYGVIGPSGGGKSVLLKCLAGVLPVDGGEISYGGITRREISLMFQEGALFDSMNVFENVAFPLLRGASSVATLAAHEIAPIEREVRAALQHVGLSRAVLKYPSQLSGGMRRRVSLARALVGSPKLILLDDPTAGLDPVASSVIMQLILDVHRKSRPTIVMVSHDLRRLLPVVDTVLGLEGGTISFMGSPRSLRDAPESLRHFVACRFDGGLSLGGPLVTSPPRSESP